jgi:CDP-4-dehydro-6-deoxyglucose reductase
MSMTVIVRPAERSFQVERDEPILTAAIRAGIGLPYGCKDGACGTCKSRLLEGRVIHGAHQLKALSVAEEDAGLILPCCATPQTDCVIEARMVPGAGEHPVVRMPCRVLAMERRAPDLRHMPGGVFTDHAFGAMKDKEILRMEGPYGSFFLREDSDKPMVLLASGTGFAPIKAIIEHMRAKDIRRPALLYWGCRSRVDLYLHEWAEAAAQSMPTLRYVPVLSEPRAEDGWSGRIGLVHEAVMQDLPDLSGHQVYACGAPIMVESARRDFVARRALPDDEFYADAFTSEKDKHEATA